MANKCIPDNKLSGKYKLIPHENTNTLSEWLKLKRLTTSNKGLGMEQPQLCMCYSRNVINTTA